MITRFTTFTVRPLIAAQNRRLQRNETVQDYYKDKVRLLRKVGLSDIDIASQLTQGMPEHYQSILIGSRVKNPNEWLEIATTLEANRKSHGSRASFANHLERSCITGTVNARAVHKAIANVTSSQNHPKSTTCLLKKGKYSILVPHHTRQQVINS
jgi:hypothetical protein